MVDQLLDICLLSVHSLMYIIYARVIYLGLIVCQDEGRREGKRGVFPSLRWLFAIRWGVIPPRWCLAGADVAWREEGGLRLAPMREGLVDVLSRGGLFITADGQPGARERKKREKTRFVSLIIKRVFFFFLLLRVIHQLWWTTHNAKNHHDPSRVGA